MNKIKQAYYYFFYKIYKVMLWTSAPFGNFFSDFRASLVIIALEIWFCITIYSYLSIFIGEKISVSITEPSGFIPYVVIVGLNIYFFNSSYKWKPYFEEFENWSKRKNLIGSIIVWSIILFIIINFFASIHYSQKKFSIHYTPEFIAKERREDSLRKALQIEKLKKIYGEDKK